MPTFIMVYVIVTCKMCTYVLVKPPTVSTRGVLN